MSSTATRELLLRYYRKPHLYKDLHDSKTPLPAALVDLLRSAKENSVDQEFRQAAVTFVCGVMLIPDGSHYRALALDKSATNALAIEHFDIINSLLAKTDLTAVIECHQHRLVEAFRILKDPVLRAEYDSNLVKLAGMKESLNDKAQPVSDGPMYTPSIQQLIDFYYNPSRYSDWTEAKASLPDGTRLLLDEVAALNYINTTSTTGDKHTEIVRRAIVVFINRVLLIGNHYRALGLTSNATAEEIQHHYRCLRRLCRLEEDNQSVGYAIARISDAYVTLRDPIKRAWYDASSLRPLSVSSSPSGESKDLSGGVQPQLLVTKPGAGNPFRSSSFLGFTFILGILALGSLFIVFNFGAYILPAQQAEINKKEQIKIDAQPTQILSSKPVKTQLESSSNRGQSATHSVTQDKRAFDSFLTIPELLIKAERELNALRLTNPPGDNAVATYNEVLLRDPGSKKARKGLARVAYKYLSLAQRHYKKADFMGSLDNIAKGLAVMPDHKGLLALQHDIEKSLEITKEADLAAFPVVVPPEPIKEISAPQSAVKNAAQQEKLEVILPTPKAVEQEKPVLAPSTPKDVTFKIEAPISIAARNASTLAPTSTTTIVSREISREELDSLTHRFVETYEAGDLSKFIALFAEDARANNRNSLDGIIEDYKTLFDTTDTRQMILKSLQWNHSSQHATGEAQFELTIKKKSEDESRLLSGNVTLEVRKEGGSAYITGLYHSQRGAQ